MSKPAVMKPQTENNNEKYVYIKVYRQTSANLGGLIAYRASRVNDAKQCLVWYSDEGRDRRISSARKVEKALETVDFLALCEKYGYKVEYDASALPNMRWSVTDPRLGFRFTDETFREAFFRCLNHSEQTLK